MHPTEPSGRLRIDEIRANLATRRIGRRIEFVESTTSTNDLARRFLKEPDADGLVVLTDHQSAGRGRFGRRWHSPRGASLLCSVVIRQESPDWNGGQLALLTGIAVRDAVVRVTDVMPAIKWPNDLIVGKRKLGGVLVESDRSDGVTTFVIGIGLNCLQQDAHLPETLTDRATSLEIESHRPIDRTVVTIAVLSEMDRRLHDDALRSAERLRAEWLTRAQPLGGRVILQHGGTTFRGTMVDVDPAAALIVHLDEGGIRAFNAADTTMMDYQSG